MSNTSFDFHSLLLNPNLHPCSSSTTCLSAGVDVSECEMYNPNKHRNSNMFCDIFNENIMDGFGMIF